MLTIRNKTTTTISKEMDKRFRIKFIYLEAGFDIETKIKNKTFKPSQLPFYDGRAFANTNELDEFVAGNDLSSFMDEHDMDRIENFEVVLKTDTTTVLPKKKHS